MRNVHLDASEHEQHIVFLHSVKPGPASKSYGLQVAALAGVPDPVINRARIKLQQLEEDAPTPASPSSSEKTVTNNEFPTLLMDYLAQIDPDETNPKQALEILYRIKQLETQS